MNRNSLYLALGGVLIVAVVFAYLLYQERHTSGVEIQVGEHGVSIDTK